MSGSRRMASRPDADMGHPSPPRRSRGRLPRRSDRRGSPFVRAEYSDPCAHGSLPQPDMDLNIRKDMLSRMVFDQARAGPLAR